jgi:hypothetical protein
LINDMPQLTAVQRAELEALGPENVRLKLMYAGASRGADVLGFRCGSITRGTVENWLVEQAAIVARREQSTLSWAKIAGWAGIVGAIVGIVGIIVAILLAK